MRRISVLILVAGLFGALTATPALASGSKGGGLECPGSTMIGKTVIRDTAGSRHVLLDVRVADEAVGKVAKVTAIGENNSSVHPGNNLIITSGGGKVVLKDVERAPGVETPANGELTLGPILTVTLVMGEDEVFSGGIKLSIDCRQPELVGTSVFLEGFCEVVGDGKDTITYIEIGVETGAELTIENIGTFTEHTTKNSVEVPPGTYAWSAVAREGYMLVVKSSGKVIVEDCTPEVPPTTTPTTVPPPPTTTPTTVPPTTTPTTTPPPPSTTIPPPNGDWTEHHQNSPFPGAALGVAGLLTMLVSAGALRRRFN